MRHGGRHCPMLYLQTLTQLSQFAASSVPQPDERTLARSPAYLPAIGEPIKPERVPCVPRVLALHSSAVYPHSVCMWNAVL
jgi:hypothetical protein